jgi:serine O-acetyltransferase
VKEVISHATVVGVPGRVVKTQLSEDEKQQQKIAQDVGFEAYGTSAAANDPVATAIHGLIQHIQAQDKRIDSLSLIIKKMGGDCPEMNLPDLCDCELEESGIDKVD